MKINKFIAANALPAAEHEAAGRADRSNRQFAAEFLKHQDDFSKEQLNMLLEQITKQGAKLGQVPTYSELKTYRELVRKFIGEAVGRMYKLQSEVGWDSRGRQKMYTTIKQVDDLLAELAEDVRHGQERQMNIMAKQDAIRGLLVDMYL